MCYFIVKKCIFNWNFWLFLEKRTSTGCSSLRQKGEPFEYSIFFHETWKCGSIISGWNVYIHVEFIDSEWMLLLLSEVNLLQWFYRLCIFMQEICYLCLVNVIFNLGNAVFGFSKHFYMKFILRLCCVNPNCSVCDRLMWISCDCKDF